MVYDENFVGGLYCSCGNKLIKEKDSYICEECGTIKVIELDAFHKEFCNDKDAIYVSNNHIMIEDDTDDSVINLVNIERTNIGISIIQDLYYIHLNKLICNHCKKEIVRNNITVDFGRIYNMVDIDGVMVESDEELSYITCTKCGKVAEFKEFIGRSVQFEELAKFNECIDISVPLKELNEHDTKEKVYSFRDLDELQNLSEEDKEKVKGYKFSVATQYPDDDSGDEFIYITVYDGGTVIGEIDMIYHSNTGWDLETNEEIVYGKPSYSYTMKLNKVENTPIEDVWKELETYQRVLEPLGYNPYPFEDCEYSDTSVDEDLENIKNALSELTDMLNVKYLHNIYNIRAEQSGKLLHENSFIMHNIFHNTVSYDFNIESIKDCQFRLLNSSMIDEKIENNEFVTPTISMLLQVWKDNKILGYIKVLQQYPLQDKFHMSVVKSTSSRKLLDLCDFYTNIYKDSEIIKMVGGKSRKAQSDGFNIPVCEKCGQVFCDCNLRCKICGKVFCEHKYAFGR